MPYEESTGSAGSEPDGPTGGQNDGTISDGAMSDSDGSNTGSTGDVGFIAPPANATLDSNSVIVEIDDGGNAALRFDLHASLAPFSDIEFTEGEVFRTGTYDMRTYVGVVPENGSTLYLRVYYTHPDGTWGDGNSHLAEGRFVDRQVTLHTVTNQAPKHPQDYADMKALFDEALATFPVDWYTQQPDRLGTSCSGYHMCQGLYALALMHEMTGESQYLERATEMAMGFVAAGQHLDNDPYLDWYFGNPDPSMNGWWNYDHYEWRSWYGISCVINALHKAADRTPEQTQALSTMLDSMVVDFYEKWQPQNYPDAANSPTGNWGGLGYVSNFSTNGTDNQSRIQIATMNLHAVTSDPKYLTFLNAEGSDIVEAVKRGYDPATDAYNFAWRNDFDGVQDSLGETTVDVSHAQDTIVLLCDAYRRGYTFNGVLDQQFMDRLTNIVTNVIWTGDSFTENVDGTGPLGSYPGKQTAGWSQLSLYDETLRQKFLAYARAGGGDDINVENQLLLFANLMLSSLLGATSP